MKLTDRVFARGTPLSTRIHSSFRPTARSSLTVVCGESRIGKVPIPIPQGVDYEINGRNLKVKGPLGELEQSVSEDVDLVVENGTLIVTRITNTKKSKAMHGLYRALCNNMFVGVSQGFEKILLMNGVGYRAAVEGEVLNMSVGFCHPVLLDIPKGVKVKVEETTRIIISGFDKAVVGNFAAIVRSIRPPEPYKGKGIKYEDEVIRMKDGKRGK